MIVLDVLAILIATALVINFYRSKEHFLIWLFESTGFGGYLFKAISIAALITTAIIRVDWSFLMYKVF